MQILENNANDQPYINTTPTRGDQTYNDSGVKGTGCGFVSAVMALEIYTKLESGGGGNYSF